MSGKELAEICQDCENIGTCRLPVVCPALQKLRQQKNPEEAKRQFIILRRVFSLYKEGKYNDVALLHFLAGWCNFAPQGEDAKLLQALGKQ